MYKHYFKRILDFFIALLALVVLSPLLLVVTVWLHFANKGAGAFFLQERPGLHGKVFRIIKFKTMTDERDAEGISGWAQCHGRNAISWTQKFQLDVWYVDHCTLKTDTSIIFTTIKKVICRADINQSAADTMEAFNGNN